MDNPPTFGEQLEAHRKAARLSKAKAATLLDISLGTWANYERGRTTPSPTTREQMLAKLAAEIPDGRKVLYPDENGTDADEITGVPEEEMAPEPDVDEPRSFAAPPSDLPAPQPAAECPPLEPERMVAAPPEPPRQPEPAPAPVAKALAWRR